MYQILAITTVSIVAMLLIDGVWLYFMSRCFYNEKIRHLIADRPKIVPAGLFYILYNFGLSYLITYPLLSNGAAIEEMVLKAALFGAVAYGTYDLTNNATLKEWPEIVTIVDIIWGSLLTGLVTLITVNIILFL